MKQPWMIWVYIAHESTMSWYYNHKKTMLIKTTCSVVTIYTSKKWRIISPCAPSQGTHRIYWCPFPGVAQISSILFWLSLSDLAWLANRLGNHDTNTYVWPVAFYTGSTLRFLNFRRQFLLTSCNPLKLYVFIDTHWIVEQNMPNRSFSTVPGKSIAPLGA